MQVRVNIRFSDPIQFNRRETGRVSYDLSHIGDRWQKTRTRALSCRELHARTLLVECECPCELGAKGEHPVDNPHIVKIVLREVYAPQV